MVTAKQVINSTKPKRVKAPTGPTKLGSAGYDNVRDDIEKTKSLREGSVNRTPTADIDIANKKYVDDQIALVVTTGATGSWTAGSGETITVVDGLVTLITSSVFFILLETGDFILLETGDKILNG